MRIFTLVFIAIPFLILGQPSSCDSLPMFFNQIFPDSLDDIDSFCIELHSGNDYPYKGQNWPGCPNRWKLDNPFWYTFIAGGTDVTINIESSDCRYNAGSQVSIYELPKHIVYHPDSTGINPEILDANLVNDCILPACTTNPRNFFVQHYTLQILWNSIRWLQWRRLPFESPIGNIRRNNTH